MTILAGLLQRPPQTDSLPQLHTTGGLQMVRYMLVTTFRIQAMMVRFQKYGTTNLAAKYAAMLKVFQEPWYVKVLNIIKREEFTGYLILISQEPVRFGLRPIPTTITVEQPI